MLKGFYLTLMIGPAVPIPVSQEVLDSLISVEVETTSGSTSSGFELNFSVRNSSPLVTLFLIGGGANIPLVRVVIVVTINGTPEVLIDGVMTHHEMRPGADGAPSTLVIKGKDLSAVMDYIDFSGIPFPAMPAEARVALILAKYLVFGVVPMVLPSVLIDIPLPTEQIPFQRGKDLGYVRQLAADVGYVFYLEPGPTPGMSFAYWGPEIKVGAPQSALNINMDAHTNVESLSFKFDHEKAIIPLVMIQNQATKVPIPIPIPPITPLNPPLGLIPPFPKAFPKIRGTAKLSPIRAIMVGMAKASNAADAVTAAGTLNVLRYGRVLKARRLVGVRGAGLAFDGLYYVRSVTHHIKRGEYKQSFTLSRNGLVSTFPKVAA